MVEYRKSTSAQVGVVWRNIESTYNSENSDIGAVWTNIEAYNSNTFAYNFYLLKQILAVQFVLQYIHSKFIPKIVAVSRVT